MGIERTNLQREKEAFEEQKREMETQNVLSTMPSTPL
jgi:hypothetical protein